MTAPNTASPDTAASDFKFKWGPGGAAYDLNERQGAQTYFLELCTLLGVPAPGTQDGYVFEKQTQALGQTRGFADVFYKNRFAWENKAPGKNLDDALKQLLNYSLALDNPPLLVVCDRLEIRVHTQFNGHPSFTLVVTLADITNPAQQQVLRRVWLDPESFKPAVTNRDITEKAAKSFATLADNLRKRGPQTVPEREQYAEQIAHFLTQTLFCFFAEDVGLLPGRMFERLVGNRQLTSQQLTNGMQSLFSIMQVGGLFGADYIPWFNGGLFKTVHVPKLEIPDITELRNAASLNWSAIDVSIFGTLFERGLDPTKRSQLGAHYTDPATIQRIIEPVIRRPLLQKWELLEQVLRGLMAKSTKKNDTYYRQAHAQYVTFLQSLADFKILDPACGSGNFLFLGLKALKDIEHQVITQAELLRLERPIDLCTSPANMLGIELNEYAAELARVTVWIGELQWRMEHGYPFKDNPILEPLDCIEQRDAILSFNISTENADNQFAPTSAFAKYEGGKATKRTADGLDNDPKGLRIYDEIKEQFLVRNQWVSEARWPKASVVIGNPPFLGGSKKRRELGDMYFEALDAVYKDRVPGGADLVCYWFEKARKAIQTNGLGAAGLVSTQSIRAGSNRKVLAAINRDSRIFEAWSDEAWVNEGASVRVSLVAFGWGECCFLNNQKVARITSDLTASASDITTAERLSQNGNTAFKGAEKTGKFEVSGDIARAWLGNPNPNGKSNAFVIAPWFNGSDITDRPKDQWIVDYGVSTTLHEAELFELPFSHIEKFVRPERITNKDRSRRENWWRFGRNGADMRAGIAKIDRFIATPRVAKHRNFVWLQAGVSADSRLFAIARADDTTMGILSSRIHEVWSLAQASMHGVGNDPTYNAKSCFETFPFPAGLTPADTAHQRTQVAAGGAVIPSLAEPFLVPNRPVTQVNPAQAAIKSIVHHNANTTVDLATATANATAIAQAAKRLDDLRLAWLNPPEWTQRVPEVVPLGMASSPYPDRILPRNNLPEADAAALQKRTLTNLYNQRQNGQVQWLQHAHQQLDAAVATAYGWADYTPAMPDETILQRLLALNLERASLQAAKT